MLNRYPWWKYAIIAVATLIGIVYALPNVYGEDPAVQVSPTRSAAVDQALYRRVAERISQDGISPKTIELGAGQLLVRLKDTDDQLKVADSLEQALGRDYSVALNLAPSTPAWLRALNAHPMFLGLDLRGGVHFLMEVDMKAVVKQAEERYVEDIRALLRNEKVRYVSVGRNPGGGVRVSFREAADRDQALGLIRDKLTTLQVGDAGASALDLVLTIGEPELRERRTFALQQNITTLRNRVNALGVAEPVIQQQGESRIVVQLPGIQDTARAKEILGATATLEFRLVDSSGDINAALQGQVPINAKLYKGRDGRPYLLDRRVILTGDSITDASSGIEQQSGSPAVYITLDGKGAKRMEDGTKDNIGKLMATVFIETRTETRTVDGQPQKVTTTTEEVINAATIRDRLGARFQITGIDSPQEARNLALLLRAGALSAPIQIVEERTVGPSAGKENIEQGFDSALVGFLIVAAFMIISYRLCGVVAVIALAANVVLIIAILSLFQATLTLPGIAGIVLTMGMAVDANVLIYERMREEIDLGLTPQAAIKAGFDRAFATIVDANFTHLIAGVALLLLGSGPVRGFAVTLIIGILTSQFTAVMVSRGVINLIYGGRKVERLSV
ncbi:preprotein translocase subunit SecD [Plasticicumulans lactativorans]|uniref:Protein translocase subunit SecD n=1 Tax=Plasticicumulans lactativorans TaxID=1133106 RepID=A0A4R2LD79_9GAMM|nr:protein translocase subunit SecD [Plasticicumulans lactativorans]TCO82396.1 preprotein translocase subunit SecD [Plasticicumulans lactativorans]